MHGLNNEAFVFDSDRVIRLTGAHFIFIDNPVSKAAKLMLMLAHSLTSYSKNQLILQLYIHSQTNLVVKSVNCIHCVPPLLTFFLFVKYPNK